MKTYECEFEYKIKEYGSIVFDGCEDPDDAEQRAVEYVEDTYPDVSEIEITSIKEVKELA